MSFLEVRRLVSDGAQSRTSAHILSVFHHILPQI